MTKKLPVDEKVNRKPISRACNFCHQKHLQCDSSRPCKNCIKRGLEGTCQDIQRKRAKYLLDASKDSKKSNNPSTIQNHSPQFTGTDSPRYTTILPNIHKTPDATLQMDLSRLESPSPVGSTSSHPQRNGTPQRVHTQLPQSSMKSSIPRASTSIASKSGGSEYSPDVFSSLFANQEYTQLTDLLDNSGAPADNSPSQSSTIYNNEFQTSLQGDNNTRPYISLSDNSTTTTTVPNIVLSSEVPDYSSPLIIRHLIKTPEDVYTANINSYNYPKAYHALLNYLKKRFNKEQLMKIAETMADYRPSFIAATRSLVELDLLFAERAFQRSLLEYESMSSLSSSPTIMWRRTGEIVAVSTEFSSLTQHTKSSLLSKRTFIIELMNDSSALDYFRLFSSVAFGDLNGVIITECTLVTPNGETIRCASTWTVKRDIFDIPMLIVGQFLPILQAR